jgi:hypothetical protein
VRREVGEATFANEGEGGPGGGCQSRFTNSPDGQSAPFPQVGLIELLDHSPPHFSTRHTMATIQYNTKMFNNDEAVVDLEYGSIKGTTLTPSEHHYEQDDSSSFCYRCMPKTVFLNITVFSLLFGFMFLIIFGVFMGMGLVSGPIILAFHICCCLLPAIISGFSAYFSIVLRGKLNKHPSSRIVQLISRRTSLAMSIVWGLALLVCAGPTSYLMWAGLINTGVNGCYDSCGVSVMFFSLGFVNMIAMFTLLVLYAVIVCKLKSIPKKRGIQDPSGCSLFGMLMTGNINP